MTEQEIIEGNKLIAHFMGAKSIKPIGHTGRDIEFPVQTGGLYVHQTADLKYHSSWDWLMPVVEKIENTKTIDPVHKSKVPTNVIIHKSEGWEKNDFKQTCDIIQFTWDGHKISNSSNSKIEAIYKSVVQFIQWYNSKQQNNQ